MDIRKIVQRDKAMMSALKKNFITDWLTTTYLSQNQLVIPCSEHNITSVH